MGDNKKMLGIDYGDKRVGVAIGLTEGKIALPREIIDNKGVDFVLGRIKEIIEEEDIDVVVVGAPFSLSKKDKSEQFKKTENFVKKFKKEINIELFMEDERLSTKEAEGLLRGGKKKNKDDVAAALILQSYLNRI